MGKVRLLRWNELCAGMTVWEDWLYGTGTTKVEVLGREDGEIIRFRRTDNDLRYLARDSSDYRFWSGEPTLEEREFTPW